MDFEQTCEIPKHLCKLVQTSANSLGFLVTVYLDVHRLVYINNVRGVLSTRTVGDNARISRSRGAAVSTRPYSNTRALHTGRKCTQKKKHDGNHT